MKIHSIIRTGCLFTSAGCFCAGYLLAGYWLIVPVFAGMAIFRLIMNRYSPFWSASSLLLSAVILAIIGVTLDLSIHLMIIGCASALACWDLVQFKQSIADNPPPGMDAPLERYHLQSLVMAVFTGLFLALIGSYINLQLPFGATVFLVLLAMGCFTYGVQFLVGNR